VELGTDDLGRRVGVRTRLLLGIVVVAAAVLGYGAWQAHTHADVWLMVKDHAGRTPKQLWADATDARLVLRDAAGRTLVEAVLEPPQGLPRYSGPQGVAVDCKAAQGGAAWRDCWQRQARWMAQWAPQASSARVTVGQCVVDPVPVTSKLYTSWWFWWVPLPHVGGTPINHYTISLHLDSERCAIATPPY
jgi:hypothetical protein